MRITILLTLCFMSLQVMANERNKCRHSYNGFRCLEYIRNYDGDTVTVNIPRLHPILGQEISIRLYGIDTPEIKGKTECEKRVAIIARDYLQARILKAKPGGVEVRNVKRDKYFRILGEIWVNGKSMARALLKNNLAVEYFGESKEEIDWCAMEPNVPSYLEVDDTDDDLSGNLLITNENEIK